MMAGVRHDSQALALGAGLALTLYYSLAVYLVVGGSTELDRPGTWLGLAAGVSAVLFALRTRVKYSVRPDEVSRAS